MKRAGKQIAYLYYVLDIIIHYKKILDIIIHYIKILDIIIHYIKYNIYIKLIYMCETIYNTKLFM